MCARVRTVIHESKMKLETYTQESRYRVVLYDVKLLCSYIKRIIRASCSIVRLTIMNKFRRIYLDYATYNNRIKFLDTLLFQQKTRKQCIVNSTLLK